MPVDIWVGFNGDDNNFVKASTAASCVVKRRRNIMVVTGTSRACLLVEHREAARGAAEYASATDLPGDGNMGDWGVGVHTRDHAKIRNALGNQPGGTSREMQEHEASGEKPYAIRPGHVMFTVHSVLVISGLGLGARTTGETANATAAYRTGHGISRR